MDFFEAQARAKRRTARLVGLFALAVLGTAAAAYVAALLALHAADSDLAPRRPITLWRPDVLLWTAGGTLAVVSLASLYKWSRYSAGGSAVAESVGARRVDPRTIDTSERRLLNVVEEMAIASGLPMPAVYLLDDEPAINAFAAGLATTDAAVCVTRGAMEKLSRDELQGVVGHEFSHILNGDMRLNLRIASLLFGILFLALAGRGLLSSLRNVRPSSSRRDKGGGGLIALLLAVGLALLVIGYVGYFFGRLIQAAVSRQREFLADASAVQFTRNPAGLSGALRKIGGYALGSSLQTAKAAAIGHFFFAQGFRSAFDSLFATHPPLAERIRSIDPSFEGRMFAPAEAVDVARESFVSAGLAPAAPFQLDPAAARAAVDAIGSLSAAGLSAAHRLLDDIPAPLRDATRSPDTARLLVFGLLLADDPATRERQLALVASHASPAEASSLAPLVPEFLQLRPDHKLPLLQISLPSLRQLPPAALDPFLATLDELVHADARVSTFEFALQKLLAHALALGRPPGARLIAHHSFQALAPELSLVLSTLALGATANPASAEHAFAVGAAHLPLAQPRLRFVPAAGLATLDRALEKLSSASPPIKQRLLHAAAHTVTADGRLLLSEAEMLRAISAALDCPMPPLPSPAASA